MNGPKTVAMPNTEPNTPNKRPRSRGGYMSAMIANETVMSAPAPRPWIARHTISCIMPPPSTGSAPNSPLSPHSAEPARNSTTPTIRMPLRPY